MGGMMGGMMGFGFPGLLMMGSVVLVIVGAILLLVLLFRRSDGSTSGLATSAGANSSGQEMPLTILQRRYAGGEIGSEEYQRIRSDLLRDGNS